MARKAVRGMKQARDSSGAVAQYRRLFIFVEGDDDARFAKQLLVPALLARWDHVRTIRYARKKDKWEWVSRCIAGIRSMRADYWLLADRNSEPCVSAAKSRIKNAIRGLDPARALVVAPEIEAWYAAGVPARHQKRLGLERTGRTVELTKEQFEQLIPKRYTSAADWKVDVLKVFAIREARKRNGSFAYAAGKLGL